MSLCVSAFIPSQVDKKTLYLHASCGSDYRKLSLPMWLHWKNYRTEGKVWLQMSQLSLCCSCFHAFLCPPPPFLIEFYGETVCLFNLPLWIHLQCDRSSLCFRMCQWDHDNASQTVKVCILIDYPWSSLATSSATNSTPGGTERRGWGGVKGREKTLKSFKRICVNSSKTSLCDVSQSIGD